MKKPTEITYVPPIVTIAEIEIENGIAASPVDAANVSNSSNGLGAWTTSDNTWD